MKICAIICEYNPFHTGHAHHILEAKKASGCDAVVCVMSGNFVQRAEPAALDYSFRAKAAVSAGADAVIIMPIAVSVACAEKFALGAVNIISQIKGVTHISFGAENNSLPLLKAIAKIQESESSEFSLLLKERLALGESYPSALSFATAIIAEKLGFKKSEVNEALKQPNNVLAIEYIKAINKLKVNIEPVPILRKGAGYSDLTLLKEFASASALRKAVSENDILKAKSFLPIESQEVVINEMLNFSVKNEILSALILYSIRALSPNALTDCPSELKENFIFEANKSKDYNEFLTNIKSKRYPLSRLKRISMYALLKISESELDFSFPLYSRLIAVSQNFKKHLSVFSETTVKKNADFPCLNKENQALVNVDIAAESVYALITGKGGNPFYKRGIIII